MENKKDYSIIPIFLVVFIDLIGIGIALPILAPMFLDAHSPLFASGTPLAERTIMLGILLGLYPLMQFFGSPILGALSDFHGRKKMLTIPLFGACVGYVLFAIGISTGNLWLLIIGRAIDGFAGGSIAIAQSAIADISDPKTKAKNFGLIGMAFGLGFILGPFIGGKLGDPNVVSWFNYSTPFWFAAVLCLINFILIQFLFKETLKQTTKKTVDMFVGIRNLKKAFSVPNLRIAFASVFLIFFGFTFFTQFFQVFLIEKFAFTQSEIGDFFAFLGLCAAISQGLIVRVVSKHLNPQQSLRVSVLLLAITVSSYLLINDRNLVYLVVPFIALFNGITLPNTTALISNLGDSKSQGEILGINQSVIAAAWSLPALLSGFLAAVDLRLPIILASTFMFIGWLVFVLLYHPKDKQVFHEQPVMGH